MKRKGGKKRIERSSITERETERELKIYRERDR
jgi:hypothetical protein